MTGNDENHRRRYKKDSNKPGKQLNRIFIRDNGICQLCFQPCNRADASRDHIIEFRYCTVEQARDDSNIRLAHITCNNIRSNKSNPNMNPQEAFSDFPTKHLTYKPFQDLRL